MTGTTTPPPTTDDADLHALLPRPTLRRSTLLVLGAVLALALAWWSPTLLRPTLGSFEDGAVQFSSGGATSLPDSDLLAVSMDLDPRSVGPLEVVRVEDVSGAEVVGAWIVPVTAPGDFDRLNRVGADDAPVTEGTGALPAEVPAAPASLEVLWRVTDCQALDPDEGVDVAVRTAYGLTSTTTLDASWSPGGMRANVLDETSCP